MESIDIQNRSFVARYVKCYPEETISFQVKPLKKSLDLSIYRKPLNTTVPLAPPTKQKNTRNNTHQKSPSQINFGDDILASYTHLEEPVIPSHQNGNNIQRALSTKTGNSNTSLHERMIQSGFTLVKDVGHLDGDFLKQGLIEVTEDSETSKDTQYYYAFILDNVASKNVKKKVLYNATILNKRHVNENISLSEPPNIKSKSGRQDSELLTVGTGRYLQGYLLKKRRKKLQGFKKRFFSLDFKYGTLSYFLNDHNQTCRGEIVISLSTVSASKREKSIVIDSGMEIWALKAQTLELWNKWIEAIQLCYDNQLSTIDQEKKEVEALSPSDSVPTISVEQFGGPNPELNDPSVSTPDLKSTNPLLRSPANGSLTIPNILPESHTVNNFYSPSSFNDRDMITQLLSDLKVIQQRVDKCKVDSFNYIPKRDGSNSTENIPIVRQMRSVTIGSMSSSASSTESSDNIANINPQELSSSSSVDLLSSSISPKKHSYHPYRDIIQNHQLYRDLSDLNDFVDKFVKKTETLFLVQASPNNRLPRNRLSGMSMRTIRNSVLSENFSLQRNSTLLGSEFEFGDDEFFDAEDILQRGVILLSDDEGTDQDDDNEYLDDTKYNESDAGITLELSDSEEERINRDDGLSDDEDVTEGGIDITEEKLSIKSQNFSNDEPSVVTGTLKTPLTTSTSFQLQTNHFVHNKPQLPHQNTSPSLRSHSRSIASPEQHSFQHIRNNSQVSQSLSLSKQTSIPCSAVHSTRMSASLTQPTTTQSFIPTHPHISKSISTEASISLSKDIVSVSTEPLPWPHKIKRRNDVKPANSTPPSILSFLRKNVGKDMGSIAMPVTSNEPLTILQAFSEMFEYADILTSHLQDKPLAGENHISIVSAFALSALSMYRDKVRNARKPFNPLLGETFELVREDMGFRLISEKVCHKPQIFAVHVEHKDWECNYTVSPVQKFWGKSVELNNEGVFKLKMKNPKIEYKWSQPTTMLKSLIAGERYIEPIKDFTITGSDGSKSKTVFKDAGMFGGRSEDVTITVNPSKGKKEVLVGKWTESVANKSSKKVIWNTGDLVKDFKKKYGFTIYAANLNEITEIEKGMLPPTDSRLRPDVRAFEDGDNDRAEQLKLKLEQDQRERRNAGNDVVPLYFKKVSDMNWEPLRGPDSYWSKRAQKDWSNVRPLW